MAIASSCIYDILKQDMLGSNAINLAAAGNLCKCALFTSSYPSAGSSADTAYGVGNLNANEVSYGAATPATAYSMTAANNSIITTAHPVIGWTNTTNGGNGSAVWTSASFTANCAVIYNSTVSNHAVCCILFGGDKQVTAGTFTISWNASGILTLT